MAIQLNLELEEVNGIMESLGNMPYIKAAPIVDKIRQQATPQVQQQQQPSQPVTMPAPPAEVPAETVAQ